MAPGVLPLIGRRPLWTIGTGGTVSLTRLQSTEECESGRIGTTGNRVSGNQPWVQIPPPPLKEMNEKRDST